MIASDLASKFLSLLPVLHGPPQREGEQALLMKGETQLVNEEEEAEGGP
jgi:hypothetical protein